MVFVRKRITCSTEHPNSSSRKTNYLANLVVAQDGILCGLGVLLAKSKEEDLELHVPSLIRVPTHTYTLARLMV